MKLQQALAVTGNTITEIKKLKTLYNKLARSVGRGKRDAVQQAQAMLTVTEQVDRHLVYLEQRCPWAREVVAVERRIVTELAADVRDLIAKLEEKTRGEFHG